MDPICAVQMLCHGVAPITVGNMLVSFVGDRATQLLYTPQLVFIVDRYSKQWQKDRVSGTIMYSRSCLFVYSMRKHVPYALIDSLELIWITDGPWS